MIRVSTGEEPSVLKNNSTSWTKDLLSLVRLKGGFSKLSESDKSLVRERYGDKEIRDALSSKSTKCIYCESLINVTSFVNVEHYYPKSLYPEKTYIWDNLFPCCSYCNSKKGSFDTKTEPFIHPVIDDPESRFKYDDCVISCADPNDKGAINVIEKCDLKRTSLCRALSSILLSFLEYRERLEKSIQKYDGYIQRSKKLEVAVDIKESLDNLRSMAQDSEQYSGYIRFLLRKYSIISEALIRVNSHKSELGIANGSGYDWGFSY